MKWIMDAISIKCWWIFQNCFFKISGGFKNLCGWSCKSWRMHLQTFAGALIKFVKMLFIVHSSTQFISEPNTPSCLKNVVRSPPVLIVPRRRVDA